MTPFTQGGRIDFFSATAHSPVAPINTQQDEILLSSIQPDDQMLLSAISEKAAADEASLACAILQEWVKTGEHYVDSLEDMITSAIIDDDGKETSFISEDERHDIQSLRDAVAQASIDLAGLPAKSVQRMFEDEDEDLAIDLASEIDRLMSKESEDEMLADYAAAQGMLLSATKKVVRDGEIVRIKKPIKKRRLSAAQRKALKMARKKAHSSAAKAKRKKSNRLRARTIDR